ncbi:hypothetical protein INT44_003477 [Umbelopsis vinacea]|uniref:Arf-GAP domain-containing protein n=1 Tax=Umbelopsis vinacea TaxID=44442 RepID=A0A8H7UHX0_9FUNG|nr:hypothetical protein INT44_003477 [Umbelopsis vinacea]
MLSDAVHRIIQALLKEPVNKKCFDCPNKIPSYVNLSIQTFICSRCSGLIREVGHRVKSLTASNFSGPETVALQNGGNAVAQRIWLGHYKGTAPEPETDSDVRWFMRQKYYESKWCNQELLKSHMEKVQSEIKVLFNADGQRRPIAKLATRRQSEAIEPPPPPTSKNNIPKPHINTDVADEKLKSWIDDNIPLGLSQSTLRQGSINSPIDLIETSGSTPPHSPIGPVSSRPFASMPLSARVIPVASVPPSPSTTSTTSSLFDDLASLQIGTQSKLPAYEGGMLSPRQIGQATTSHLPSVTSKLSSNAASSTSIGTDQGLLSASSAINTGWNHSDPYAELRNFSELDQRPPTSSEANSRPYMGMSNVQYTKIL